MKVAEKRMNYYNLSSNIIACDNFLPPKQIEDLYIDFLNYRKNISISKKDIHIEKTYLYVFDVFYNDF